MSLKEYNRKRIFSQTPEPKGKAAKAHKGSLRFVVQLHDASRMHYDFRLEIDGVLKSWAVPKGPSMNPMDQRLAVHVEDHPLDYGGFEGIIPSGNYGAGTVMVWDEGTYIERSSEGRKDSEKALLKGLEKGHITFVLDGHKLQGEFALIKLKNASDGKSWLLVKKRDDYSNYKDITRQNLSVKTGRSMEKIAEQSEKKGDVWESHKKSRPKKMAITKPKEFSLKPAPIKKTSKLKVVEDQLPRRLKPMIPTTSSEVPSDGWIFEKDLDGLRAIAELDGRSAHLHSKSLLPFERKFPEIMDDLKQIKDRMVLDGEIAGQGGKSTYWVYDILFFNGKDLRESPLSERKKVLEKAFKDSKLVKHQAYEESPNGLSGSVIAKESKGDYKSGTTKSWLRVEVKNGSDSKTSKAVTQGRSGSGLSPLRLTHLDKVYFPEEGYTKGDIIEYYRSVSKFILPHLKDRPESLNRHPNGIEKASFYQKDVTGYTPKFFKTQRIYSESTGRSIDYALVQNEESLLYVANLGCIELNPWFSRTESLDNPDFLVIDLDPDDDNTFRQVMEIAKDVHELLDEVGAKNFIKTSGATGMHICVPTAAKYDYDTVRKFAEEVCTIIQKKHPATTSILRSPDKRRKKIYLDFMQNNRGQTLASVYSVRPKPGAPVSTPLEWSELKPNLRPEQFNIKNTLGRIKEVGDLWAPLLKSGVDLEKCSRSLSRLSKE